MNTHGPRLILLCTLILLLVCHLPIASTPAQETRTLQPTEIEPYPDMLIILSPQYTTDKDINNAIQTYRAAVKNDLGWNSQIIPIQPTDNTYQHIDDLIETAYKNHPLKACIMVGEDLHTALAGDCDYLEQPSTLPWATLGGISAYETTDQGILCKPSTTDICISLLYPTHTLAYEEKKSSLIFAFTKFATRRQTPYPNTIRVFESSDLNTNSKTIYQQLNQYAPLIYTEDATDAALSTSLTASHAAFFVHGHSNPSGTDIHRQKNTGWFSADHLNALQTPFFGADGCYAAGWWSNQQDNNILDPSIDACWYGSNIFTSNHIMVLALGLLSQNGYQEPVSFLENVIPALLNGTTLCEAMIGQRTIGDTIIIGDPTFHYTVY